jgi:hypothetical protein
LDGVFSKDPVLVERRLFVGDAIGPGVTLFGDTKKRPALFTTDDGLLGTGIKVVASSKTSANIELRFRRLLAGDLKASGLETLRRAL